MDKISKLSERVRVLEKSVLWCLHLRRNPLRENLTLFINTVFLPFFSKFWILLNSSEVDTCNCSHQHQPVPRAHRAEPRLISCDNQLGKSHKNKVNKVPRFFDNATIAIPSAFAFPFPFPSQIPLPGSEMLWMGLWVHISDFHFIAARVNLNEQTVNWAQGALPSPAPRETSNECNYEFIDKVPFLAAVVAKCIQCTRTICCVSRGKVLNYYSGEACLSFTCGTWWQWQLKTAEAR